MESGSGWEMNGTLTSSFLPRIKEINPTVFVPRTGEYQTTTQNQTLVENLNNLHRPLFNITSSSPINVVAEDNFTPRQVATKKGLLFSATGNSSFSTQEIAVSNPLGTTLPGPIENNPVVLIVGITCGVIGLLLGILITAAVWIYMYKKRNTSSLTRTCHASVHAKNPKEMTFEPLDLSLTLPTYAQSSTTLDKRKSLSDVLTSTPVMQEEHFPEEKNLSYQSYSPPSPPEVNPSNYHNTLVASSEHEDQTCETKVDQRCLKASNHDHLQKCGRNRSTHKRPISISTRDSFSSGLGTGTESDIFPYDGRGMHAPGRGASDSSQLNYDLPAVDKILYIRHEQRQRNRNEALGVVKESAGRRSKRSISGNQKKRLTRKSDTSSSYASSGTTSINEWSSTDTSSSPSSTLPFSTDHLLLPSASSAQPKAEVESITENRGEWSSGESTDKEEVENWQKHDTYEADEADSTADNNDDVVSTYFDMHFPSTSTGSDDTRTNAPHDQSSMSPILSDAKIRKITVVRRDSDIIHL